MFYEDVNDPLLSQTQSCKTASDDFLFVETPLLTQQTVHTYKRTVNNTEMCLSRSCDPCLLSLLGSLSLISFSFKQRKCHFNKWTRQD